jgi:formate/nitrite transporter FocA (FNT family)
MDYVNPQDAINEVRQVAVRKASLPMGQMLLRGALAGAFLWWIWNQIPVTGGNIVAGVFLTGMALYMAYPKPHTAEIRPVDQRAIAFGATARIESV